MCVLVVDSEDDDEDEDEDDEKVRLHDDISRAYKVQI